MGFENGVLMSFFSVAKYPSSLPMNSSFGIDGESPCEFGVASLSALRPASLGSLLILDFGILAAGLWWDLNADRAAFRITFGLPPVTHFWGGISAVNYQGPIAVVAF
jgi:hypothetical protein